MRKNLIGWRDICDQPISNTFPPDIEIYENPRYDKSAVATPAYLSLTHPVKEHAEFLDRQVQDEFILQLEWSVAEEEVCE